MSTSTFPYVCYSTAIQDLYDRRKNGNYHLRGHHAANGTFHSLNLLLKDCSYSKISSLQYCLIPKPYVFGHSISAYRANAQNKQKDKIIGKLLYYNGFSEKLQIQGVN